MNTVASKRVTIVNKLGLHARAAAKFVKLASRFEAQVCVRRDEQEVDAKSIMSVMMLAASRGVTLEIRARGDDAETAVEQLEQLIKDRFGEGE